MTKWIMILLLLVSACNHEQRPKGIIPPKKMQSIISDYLRTDIYLNEFAVLDSGQDLGNLGRQMRQQIFNKHKVSPEDYYSSYRYYTQHPGEMREIIDSMLAVKQMQDTKAALDQDRRSRQFEQLKNLKPTTD